ncbi:indole-3-glycerol phosphate synthase TrpC [Anaerosporobacter sp.]|uniref:indole-3-glycerol phosphate synthase TrpC n=1 Tax=Anaerosporobacter sp. TaxID=1872529 RepID=UPI00286FA27D|nr:indole-3-glycerol phosphate synthase TrpC [Anaerosporobacter sp.]
MNILEEIAEKTKLRVATQKEEISLEEMKQKALECMKNKTASFEEAIAKEGLSFICEAKKASPSKGVIAEDFPYVEIAKDYEAAGASAISVLTEPHYFKGDNAYLQEITKNVSIPVLRKDFTVDEYQIYEAKAIGASAILLICAILDDEQLHTYIEIANSLQLSVLVEAHDEEEVKRGLQAGAKIIGVNNRDLKTFKVDIHNSIRLRALVPKDILFVSESGIKTTEDIKELVANGVDGVLIGETMMTASNRREQLQELIESSRG